MVYPSVPTRRFGRAAMRELSGQAKSRTWTPVTYDLGPDVIGYSIFMSEIKSVHLSIDHAGRWADTAPCRADERTTPVTWAEKIESLERMNSMRESKGSFDSCSSYKRLTLRKPEIGLGWALKCGGQTWN